MNYRILNIDINFEKRNEQKAITSILVTLFAIFCSLIFAAIIIYFSGAAPLNTMLAMFEGAFGNFSQWKDLDFYNLSEVIVKTVPLTICALGISVAYKMRFWNIGAEGQFVAGALASSLIALQFDSTLGKIPLLTLMFVASFAFGAIVGFIPAILKIFRGVNEVVVSLMLNYIVILFTEYLAFGPLRDPKGFGFPGTREFAENSFLPTFGTTRMDYGIFIMILLAIILWIVFKYSKWGYELKILGENPRAGFCSGMNVSKNILWAMIISGGISALAGFTEIAGSSHRLQKGLAVGNGYSAIIVAWISRLNPFKILLWSFLFSVIIVGGDQLQITSKLPKAIALVIQGAILLFILAGDFFVTYKVRLNFLKLGSNLGANLKSNLGSKLGGVE
ncbi:MAG: ABC transporter permease [Oligoflexia bacterium]|nr:ABC transporter permease [Oligoflexia bacterium]